MRVGLLLVIAACVFYGIAASEGGANSTTKSYYSDEQVERAGSIYAQHCATCHGNSLQGSGSAPPLVGLPFMSYWGARDALELFEYTHEAMPLDRPGSLTTAQYADLVALMLHANELPGGDAEFPHEIDEMQGYPLTVE